jgi:hypothetical protein
MKLTPLEDLSHAAFAAQVKTKSRVWIDAQNSVELELVEVTPPRLTSGKNASYENFALNFLGPARPLLPQRIYRFESSSLGEFELFIVPVGQDATGIQYQATFNRLAKPA